MGDNNIRIIDQNGNEITSPDLSLGRLEEEKILIAHHDAVDAVEEKWHYEIVAEYPNGGKDVEKIVDVPGVDAMEAWDEYENILRYIPYTDDELADIEAAKNAPTLEDEISELREALNLLLSGAIE